MADKVDPAITAALAEQERFKKEKATKDPDATDRPEDGFEVFGAEPEMWELKGSKGRKYTFEIGPLRMGQISELVPLLGVLQEPLAEMFKTGNVNISALQRIDGASLMECVAITTNQTQEAVADLTAEDFIRVCTKVLAVNGDFFVRTLPRVAGGAAAAILRLVTGVAKIEPSAGQSPSSDSVAPVIPSKT